LSLIGRGVARSASGAHPIAASFAADPHPIAASFAAGPRPTAASRRRLVLELHPGRLEEPADHVVVADQQDHLGRLTRAVSLDDLLERLVGQPHVAAHLVGHATDQVGLVVEARHRLLGGDHGDLRFGDAGIPRQALVLRPLVAGARCVRHTQHGDLAASGVERRRQHRAPELEERPESPPRPGDHPEHVERGDLVQHLAVLGH
jgi:hypothetical protein